jgi:cytochrome c-type biogenesis protein CcmF
VIATVGNLAIIAALGSAIAVTVQGLRGRCDGTSARLAIPVGIMAASALAVFVTLEVAIFTHEFSIAYVANNTATTTPLLFLFAAGWAALEGSIVLWGVVLAWFTLLVWRRLEPRDPLGVLALGIMGAVAVFWFALMATAGNPFSVCTDVTGGACSSSSWWPFVDALAPLDGRGPNPLLQNHILMAIHPPMLYIGYVGFTVPFAFAIGALMRADVGKAWLDRTHRWSMVAWAFLTFGIILGGWWSYEVLGWGGYWAWDPVENAAFLPWLVATAFIHSAVVQRKRGMLQAWNFVLVIATFSLTILGTFLTRSGVIASVHSFTQSGVGPALLIFLAVVVVGSLALFAVRADTVAQAPRLDSLVSREGFILANNLLLTVFAFTVLFGTMYPLIVEALSGDEVSVGRPFFDRAGVPLALLLLLFLGAGAVAPWRVAKVDLLWRRLRAAVAAGLVAGAVAVVIGVRSIPVVLTIVLAVYVATAIVVRFASMVAARQEAVVSAMRRVVGNDRGYWGGQIAHVGIAIIAVSLATTNGLAIREVVTLDQGSTATVGRFCVRYIEPFTLSEPNREVNGVRIGILDASCSTTKATLEPRVNTYGAGTQPVGTPAVWTGFIDDVYVGIAGGSTTTIQLNVFIFPLQWLLWFGGMVVVAGGVFAMFRKPRSGSGTSHLPTADVTGPMDV